MGEVYQARNMCDGSDVAIKVLPSHFTTDETAASRFHREVSVLSALSHPNILVIQDFGTIDGVAFAVTELLKGETLQDAVDRAPLSWQEAVTILAQVADGLAYTHSKGVVHRDLKPANIYLTTDGRVKILDFGMARIHEADGELEALSRDLVTGPGVVLGSFPFMSPEQVCGLPVDARSDIFSFGATFHMTVTGTAPFTRKGMVRTMSAIMKDPTPGLSGVISDVPLTLERVILQCLEKDRKDRVQSASAVASALRGILDNDRLRGT